MPFRIHSLLVLAVMYGSTSLAVVPCIAAGGDLQYHRYLEPAEHAFTDLVPNGWRSGGRLVRYGPLTIAPFVQAINPAGTVFIQLGDWHVKDYADIPGWKEGTLYTPGTNIEFIRRLQTPDEYARSFSTAFEQQLGCGRSETAQSEQVENPPGLAALPQAHLETSVLHFTCSRDGQRYVGQVMISLQSYRLPMRTVGWNVLYLASFLARQDLADLAISVWNKMRTSFEFTPEWNARESMIAREAVKPAMQALDATLRQAQSFDEHIINGLITVNDPTTGTQSQIPMGVEPYYFADGLGHFYSSYNPNPKAHFHAVKPVTGQ